MRRYCMLLVTWLVVSACGGSDTVEPACLSNDDCVAGYLCVEHDCLQLEAVEITTRELSEATVDADYSQVLEASGGLQPYHWEMVRGPAWLSLDEYSGRLSGAPAEPAVALELVIAVTDSTTGRDSRSERTFYLDVDSCSTGQMVECHDTQEEACLLGYKVCSAGQFGPCGELDFSSDIERCGPDCQPCDGQLADACTLGRCSCGDGSQCARPSNCCAGNCVDLSSDARNCGACGHDCTVLLANTASASCQDGSCRVDRCNDGFFDCDGNDDNGCETRQGLEACGSCDIDCRVRLQHVLKPTCVGSGQTGPGITRTRCDYQGRGEDGEGCQSGWLDCDGNRENGCETSIDGKNCGFCGNVCSGTCLQDDNGDYTCGCRQDGDCPAGMLCCGGQCQDAGDVAHCGACDNDCRRQVLHATPVCNSGTCDYTSCQEGFLDCNGIRHDGCETAFSNENCGACGFACGQNAFCDGGSCACQEDFGNCQGGWSDGCETSLADDEHHCGDCGTDCLDTVANAGGIFCAGGSCFYHDCLPGFGDCNGQPADGCELHLLELQACRPDCGHEAVDCLATLRNVNDPTCAADGTCDFSSCRADFGNCNGDRSDGCETDFRDPASCGDKCLTLVNCFDTVNHAAGIACSVDGRCDYAGCDDAWGDCNGDRSDGCETFLRDTTACGPSCGERANCLEQLQNVVQAHCDHGSASCDYASCLNGWGNCDGDRSNGCEYDLWTPTACKSSCSSAPADCTALPHTVNQACVEGRCQYACAAGWGDCDFWLGGGGSFANGCETNLNESNQHCGTCGNACPSDHCCIDGQCVFGPCP